MDIELRVDSQPASSLNLFFDKGRKIKNGLYAPRPWNEIEITSQKKERANPCYPKSILKIGSKKSRSGKFVVYIKEGALFYCLKMTISSDYGKCIASSKESGGRETLGSYIKGKLQQAGVLREHERITSATLDLYGKNCITLKKIGDQRYILEF